MERNKRNDFIEDYILNCIGENTDLKTMLFYILQESDDLAIMAFYELRRNVELYMRTHCPGISDNYCGSAKRFYEDYCECCQEKKGE